MEKHNLVLLSVDDWSGLYVNGKMFDQGHSVELERYISSITGKGILIESFEDHYIELDETNSELDNYGNRFPELLSDVVEYQQLKNTINNKANN